MARRLTVLLFLLFSVIKCDNGAIDVPPITFEALSPQGLRVSIPSTPDTKLFGFHGKVNEEITEPEPGDLQKDVMRETDGKFVYLNPTIKLKKGDTIYYWVFIQIQQFGFRKNGKWVVGDISTNTQTRNPCTTPSVTRVNNENACSGENLLDSKFTTTTVDTKIWLIEQYIADAPDFEFVIYRKNGEVLILNNNLLTIRPKLDESIVRARIQIIGCTRNNDRECERPWVSIYQNPIQSARLVTKQTFSFGRYEIRAKIPRGDWLYPEIYLQDSQNPERRIYICFSRGNAVLTGNSGDDIGGKLLFGGPSTNVTEPLRSMYFRSRQNGQPIGAEMHKFILDWTPERMHLYFNDLNYGTIDESDLIETGFDKPSKMNLVIGVGAGGISDFPDGYKSGNYIKPWLSRSSNAVKDFFMARTQWLPTWIDGGQLQVEYVKITAS